MLPAGAEELGVVGGERTLVRGAQQLGEVDLRALVVEDRPLDRPGQEVVGMTAEELIERVLPGDEDGESAPAAAGAPPHLTQAGDGAREGRDDRRVERADVDPELERVGRDDGTQRAAAQTFLDLASLRGGVAGAIRRDLLGQLGVLRGELVAHETGEHLDTLTRLHEADRSRLVADEIGNDAGGLAKR